MTNHELGVAIRRDHLPPVRVLLLEENAAIALDTECVLMDAGLSTVAVARTVADALQMLGPATRDDTIVDAAILDLPHSDQHVTELLKRLAEFEIPYVLTSVWTGFDRTTATGLKAQLLPKPYQPVELVEAVEQMLTL